MLYKTYTIFAIDNQVIGTDGKAFKEGGKNEFIIRGCYSNKYWKEKEMVDKQLEEKKFPQQII